ncbi:short chain dehydrogenase family protein [Mycolicibacterium hassiacum DSM 44199]|jgi:NADP-dependent 3-hydroxy acid dehydrogenase YdfG|uniref:Short chain dehydrogenase family protein n=1 Tax=Mycolicibacterium hassiacum (strain DSM 44199 / CIP 105218 / JCM 12690 / 3849) TaxID=1122247 RepID=K5B997_MYCHD|nr:SDR family oxidoreductase [Mycolicibacterium hassiacum]EKF25068.1 short chain dehydrogenase family protein [Mycolicibacterium hassiacum DSM 44199]MBX5488168.1 SDR family oxidoreductase [Mycolicibacterium hassiacum]MDA4087974.1 oxidoreductase [Mycolicibacterium hassiacum DSM 44199]PZN18624.1 MAG: SDR family NAD(P)-dependent oxidoreductase [Mycolicibacterium hassiacum]VCT88345.1 putative oxidoreductase [Mycolicibacterium hassiacum DSM 44199]
MTVSKVAFVTGASSGIGRAVATRLAADGLTVVAAARRADRLAELSAQYPAVEPCPLDVTDRDAVRTAVDDTVARHGRLDVFVANAGVMPLSRLDAGRVEEWDRMIDVNVRGLLHGIHAALPHFTRQGGGHFITTASIGAHQVTRTAAVYCGTKYAAWAITEGLRIESPPGIRVTTISPGVVESELAESITDPGAREFMAEYRRHALDPDAIAAAVAYAVNQPPGVDVNEIIVRPVHR